MTPSSCSSYPLVGSKTQSIEYGDSVVGVRMLASAAGLELALDAEGPGDNRARREGTLAGSEQQSSRKERQWREEYAQQKDRGCSR